MKNLTELTATYLTYCQYRKELDPKTLKAYRIDLGQFAEFMEAYGDPFARDSLNDYVTSLHRQFRPRTTKRKIASIKAFCHYLEFEDILNQNPFSRIDLQFREPQKLPRIIPRHTIQTFLSTLYERQREPMTVLQEKTLCRDIAVTELLFATGSRISELCTLTPEQVDMQNHSLLFHGKGAKERILQIENPEVILALSNYIHAFSSEIREGRWFFVNRFGRRLTEQSVRLMLRKYASLASISLHITPHMFRHSFATFLLEEDVDIRYIQKMLGHSSITTTEIYTHVAMSKQKDILKTKHPRNSLHFSLDKDCNSQL
ncbi:MAG TPA: tyrosine-type recombinase/integrase [Candidatus Mediterraneibacter cottocaccae]|nr:tyrosine-type recombinase/integrase [Candidatus Mediterraneibacter cottocaccae]